MPTRRHALVTGCSTGIGRAVVRDLAERGWRVFATVRKAEDAAALQAEAPQAIEPLLLDVTDPEHRAAAATSLREALDGAPLHGLVHNAGIANIGPLEVMPLEVFRKQLEVNLIGVLALTQELLPLVRQGEAPRGSRRLVMISSISGKIGTPLAGAYNASKFGLEGLADALRRELLPQDIDVVLVEPGAIATAIWQTSKTRAAGLMPQLADHPAMAHYQDFADAALHKVDRIEAGAIPAERVAVVVRRALEARRPRVRHLVGRDAKLGELLRRVLPTRLFDRLLVRDALQK